MIVLPGNENTKPAWLVTIPVYDIPRTYWTRSLFGRLCGVPGSVRLVISQKRQGQPAPRYFLSTDDKLGQDRDAVYHQAPEGALYVITRYRDSNQNLRTRLARIIRKAGLTPWPKLFHNLRASRQTELVERYPRHVVCAWLGNTAAVSAEHYLQVTDAHFEAALCAAQSGTERGCQQETAIPPGIRNVREDNDMHLSSISAKTYDYPQGDSNLRARK
jgi:hypothetical protein